MYYNSGYTTPGRGRQRCISNLYWVVVPSHNFSKTLNRLYLWLRSIMNSLSSVTWIFDNQPNCFVIRMRFDSNCNESCAVRCTTAGNRELRFLIYQIRTQVLLKVSGGLRWPFIFFIINSLWMCTRIENPAVIRRSPASSRGNRLAALYKPPIHAMSTPLL